jgi:hypothetical protein
MVSHINWNAIFRSNYDIPEIALSGRVALWVVRGPPSGYTFCTLFGTLLVRFHYTLVHFGTLLVHFWCTFWYTFWYSFHPLCPINGKEYFH